MDNTLIIIGRQFGSGGKLVAEAVGRKLGIPVYDKTLLAKAAEDSGFSKEFFMRSDEKRSIFKMSNFLSSGRFGVVDNYVGDNELFKMQSKVIRGIAESGPAILVGRCSDYILRDHRRLSVFITAPMQTRIGRVCEREGISEASAQAYITKQDRTRETYYNYFTFGHWGVASNYDLCLDSSILGIERTAEAIVDFGKKAGYIK